MSKSGRCGAGESGRLRVSLATLGEEGAGGEWGNWAACLWGWVGGGELNVERGRECEWSLLGMHVRGCMLVRRAVEGGGWVWEAEEKECLNSSGYLIVTFPVSLSSYINISYNCKQCDVN